MHKIFWDNPYEQSLITNITSIINSEIVGKDIYY